MKKTSITIVLVTLSYFSFSQDEINPVVIQTPFVSAADSLMQVVLKGKGKVTMAEYQILLKEHLKNQKNIDAKKEENEL